MANNLAARSLYLSLSNYCLNSRAICSSRYFNLSLCYFCWLYSTESSFCCSLRSLSTLRFSSAASSLESNTLCLNYLVELDLRKGFSFFIPCSYFANNSAQFPLEEF